MANSLCCSPLTSLNNHEKSGLISRSYSSRKAIWIRDGSFGMINTTTFEALKVKATDSKSSTKPNSIICTDCEGNGAKSCSQCQGSGVNSVDHFNGRFKAGGLCWLCRGKKQILCGNCNGAGFIGGYMSTFDG